MFNAFIPLTQTLQLLFPIKMFNAFVKLYNFSSLLTCSMLSSNTTTSLPSQHVQCFHSLISNSTTSLLSQHVQCFSQSLQLLFPPNMFNALVKLYNFSSLPTCSMLSSNSTTSLPSQHVQCFRQTLQLLFPPNMFNAFVKLYNFSSLSTCWEGREVVEFDESILVFDDTLSDHHKLCLDIFAVNFFWPLADLHAHNLAAVSESQS